MNTIINKITSAAAVNKALKVLRKTDKDSALLLRKVYTNISEQQYTTAPTTCKDLLAAYTGAEDISELDASPLFDAISFDFVSECNTQPTPVTTEDKDTIEPELVVPVDYSAMTVVQLTNVLFADLGSEITSQVTNMTTGLKVKLDLLDELKQMMVASFEDVRAEVLTARLANALALTKEDKGSALHTTDGNLSVYDYLNSDVKTECKNYLFMADIMADQTASLDVLILESAFRSYKEQIAVGALPIPDRALTLAVTKAIKGICALKESNKDKLLSMSFA